MSEALQPSPKKSRKKGAEKKVAKMRQSDEMPLNLLSDPVEKSIRRHRERVERAVMERQIEELKVEMEKRHNNQFVSDQLKVNPFKPS